MAEDKKTEKWAANFAFTGNKETVQKVKKILDELEANGEIDDMTGIDGPYESLRLMLKRRVDNLVLSTEPPKPDHIQNTGSSQHDSNSDSNQNESTT